MRNLGLLGLPLLVAACVFAARTPNPPRPADRVAVDEPARGVAAPDTFVDTTEAPDVDPTRDANKARADFVAAQHDYERQKKLHALGELRADLEAALGRLREAKAALVATKERAPAHVRPAAMPTAM